GRTVYESLYSGGRVIIPGRGEPDFLFELEQFSDRIALYKSGDSTSLSESFACADLKADHSTGLSNVSEYVRSFDAFLDSCLTHRRSPAAASFAGKENPPAPAGLRGPSRDGRRSPS